MRLVASQAVPSSWARTARASSRLKTVGSRSGVLARTTSSSSRFGGRPRTTL